LKVGRQILLNYQKTTAVTFEHAVIDRNEHPAVGSQCALSLVQGRMRKQKGPLFSDPFPIVRSVTFELASLHYTFLEILNKQDPCIIYVEKLSISSPVKQHLFKFITLSFFCIERKHITILIFL